MNVRHSRLARLVALTVVVSMPLLGMAGVASAKVGKNYCANHPNSKKAMCQAGGGSSTGGGTGGPPVDITVTVAPNPLVETGQSEVHAIIQVETLPSFAGDVVSISSSQLVSSCVNVFYTSIANGFDASLESDQITGSWTTTATPPWTWPASTVPRARA